MKKVLIMEDEENIRRFVVINLHRAAFEVVEAENGQQALDAIEANPDIGVAILDIMSPGNLTALKSAAAFGPPISRWALSCLRPGPRRWTRSRAL